MHVSQDYVRNWTRDAAIVAIELAAGPLPASLPLIDYVQFAQTCQNSASGIGHFDRASFLINGTPRSRTDQTDGPGPADAGDPAAVRSVLPRGHGQHRRHPGPRLAEHRHAVAAERPGESLKWSVLPVG